MLLSEHGYGTVAINTKTTIQGGGRCPMQFKYSTYYWGRSNSVDVSERATGGELAYLRGDKGMEQMQITLHQAQLWEEKVTQWETQE